MTLSEKITALRIRKGWSQEEFCQHFAKRYPEHKIKRARYSKWETGENQPGLEIVKALVTFYRITADELLFDHIKLSVFKKQKKLANQRLTIA